MLLQGSLVWLRNLSQRCCIASANSWKLGSLTFWQLSRGGRSLGTAWLNPTKRRRRHYWPSSATRKLIRRLFLHLLMNKNQKDSPARPLQTECLCLFQAVATSVHPPLLLRPLQLTSPHATITPSFSPVKQSMLNLIRSSIYTYTANAVGPY